MKKDASGTIVFPLIVGILALSLRLWNVLSIGDDFYANFLSDASTYKLWASRLAAGASYGAPIFPMGPLFPYFLATAIKLGFDFYSVLFIQTFLGAGTCIFIYFVSRGLFGQTAGLVSGLLAAVCGPFIFYDGLLLSESLQVFLLAFSLFLLTVRVRKGEMVRTLAAGWLVGLAALGRGTAILFPLFVGFFWLYRSFAVSAKLRRAALSRLACLFAGTVIGILPATLHNLSHGDLVLISSNLGINFYIGNNSDASGTYEEPPGLDLSSDFTGRKVAEREKGPSLKSSEVSAFWTARTFDDIQSNPGRFLSGLFRKAWIYLWYFDIPQAESLQIQHLFSPLFRFPLVGFGLLLVFGVAGMLLLPQDEKSWVVILLFLSNMAGVVLFFVVGRFKLGGMLPLVVLAGAGIVLLFRLLKERHWKMVARYLFLAVILVAVLYLPRPIDRKAKIASAYDNVGIFHYFKGEPDSAIVWYRRALEVLPEHPAALNNIGAYFYGQGLIDSATYYFLLSLDADSTQDETLMNLGRIAQVAGEFDSALVYYRKAAEVAPFGTAASEAIKHLMSVRSDGLESESTAVSFEALVRSAEQLSAGKQFQQAGKLYREALKIRPDDLEALNNLGFVCQAQGKYSVASDIFTRVVRLSPDNAVAYNNLASAIYKMGLADSALALWQKAIQLAPNNPQIRKNIDYVQKKSQP